MLRVSTLICAVMQSYFLVIQVLNALFSGFTGTYGYIPFPQGANIALNLSMVCFFVVLFLKLGALRERPGGVR